MRSVNVTNRSLRLLSSLVCIGSLALSTPAAHASTGTEYVRLRTSKHANRALTYAEVQAHPAKYLGQVLELKGIVGGVIGSDDSLSIMLQLAAENAAPSGTPAAPVLDIPSSDAPLVREFAAPSLRVLVQVKEGGTGNVVPLKVIAVAHESTVQAVERAEQTRQDAINRSAELRRQEQARWHDVASRAARRHAAPPANDLRFMPGQSGDFSGQLSERARPLFVPYSNYISRINPKLSAGQIGTITYHLLNFADRYDVDPRLVVSMIIAESEFDPNCTSHSGAMGLGQLMPATARDLGISNPYDPVQNLGGSVAYLRSRLALFADKSMPGGGMSIEQAALAMAAYNAGENAVKKYKGIPPYRETQAYVRRVISLYRQLCS
jgi:soluble lytic murein transglycosylase-like protein